jgi:hypothetical protein
VLCISGYPMPWAERPPVRLPRRPSFLRKPFTPARLAARVRALLDAGPGEDPPA